MGAKTWSDNDIEYLCNNWGLKPAREIAAYLGKTPKATWAKAERLGCEKLKPNFVKEPIPRPFTGHYRSALPPDQWKSAEIFLGILCRAKKIRQQFDCAVNIDLDVLRDVF